MVLLEVEQLFKFSLVFISLVQIDIFIIQQIQTCHLFLLFSMNHLSLRVYVYLSKLALEWLVSWCSKASRLFQSALSFEQCCELCINLKMAWPEGGRGQAGPSQLRGHRNQILLHLYMYAIKENQKWKKILPKRLVWVEFTGNCGWQCSFLCLHSKEIDF